jgi:hypothetical protein
MSVDSGSNLTSSNKTGVIDTFIYFDSTYRDSASNIGAGQYNFSLLTLNQNRAVDNIIEMEIGDFYFPEIPTGPAYPLYFFYKHLYILILELQAQSFNGANSFRYHFDMNVQPAGIANLAASSINLFIFGKPFRDAADLTFQFYRAPFAPVQFQQDLFNFNAVAGTSPARITTALPHGVAIATTVSIFCSNFSSNVGNVDSLINSQTGFLVTSINANTLEFAPLAAVGFDFTAVLTAVPGNLVVGFRRIAFSVRFRTIVNMETNRIIPV